MERLTTRSLRLLPPALVLVLSHPSIAVSANHTLIRFPEVLFPVNSADPIDDSSFYFLDDQRINTMKEVIADMATILQENLNIVLELTGHADSDEADPVGLGLARARRVACALTSSHGIDSGRLVAVAASGMAPRISAEEIALMDNFREMRHARQLNRYVSFRVARLDWVSPIHDELAAVRFLSDPSPRTKHEQDFCGVVKPAVVRDYPQFTLADDVYMPATLPGEVAVDTVAPAPPIIAGAQSPIMARIEEPAPTILTNPVLADEVVVAWLPPSTELVRAEIMTMEGRTIMTSTSVQVRQGTRLPLGLPITLAPGAYILKLSTGTQSWSLRFVKP